MKARLSLLLFAGVLAAGAFALSWHSQSTAAPPANANASRKKPKQTRPKPGSEKAIKAFMRHKLQAMREVLRGIVTEDYALIRKNAQAMKKMGTATEWNIVQGDIYGDYSSSFLRSAELLDKAAKNKNDDGALLVYMQMTMNCIECHRYVREPSVRRKIRYQ